MDKLFFPHGFSRFFFHVFFFVGLRKHPRRRMPVEKIRTPLAGLWRCCGCVETDLGVGGGGFNINPKRAISLSLCLCIHLFYICNMKYVYKIKAHVFFSIWAIVFLKTFEMYLRWNSSESLTVHSGNLGRNWIFVSTSWLKEGGPLHPCHLRQPTKFPQPKMHSNFPNKEGGWWSLT